ncbi:class II aldolase/adducin family protein [Martelella sp. HB161492]|uniref:class II aldolase/adducin family protein n=1 Tax=Martelella sp. HB161492 TaxID=2720726 RepID=UPI001591C65D|nr:class II aldolase/adducin family protein [Martelella sp. HB161492]
MASDIQKLVDVSRYLGSNTGYVQGGGGNTSIKTDERTMYVKASGRLLDGISAETGFIPVDWQRMKRDVANCMSEDDYSALMTACSWSDTPSIRSSIETGFHAILGRCVLHSHSVWANLLNCSQEGEELASALFPDMLWVPYATPGLDLTKKIAVLADDTHPGILFLENHGLIVSADSEDAALALHEKVNETIRAHFDTALDFPVCETVAVDGLLFPDQAVYHSNAALQQTRAGIETRQAVQFLACFIPKIGLTLKFLEDAERNRLLQMESEKYRQKVSGS